MANDYPSWRYNAQGESRLIDSPDMEEEGWEPSARAHGIETAPGSVPDPDLAALRASLATGEEKTDTPEAPARRKRR